MKKLIQGKLDASGIFRPIITLQYVRPEQHYSRRVWSNMAFAALLSATFAATARRLQATDCPCLSAAPSGSTYPTFTLAGETITYPTGAVPASESKIQNPD